MKSILEVYEQALGYSINFQKSRLFFNPNTDNAMKDNIQKLLNVNGSFEGSS